MEKNVLFRSIHKSRMNTMRLEGLGFNQQRSRSEVVFFSIQTSHMRKRCWLIVVIAIPFSFMSVVMEAKSQESETQKKMMPASVTSFLLALLLCVPTHVYIKWISKKWLECVRFVHVFIFLVCMCAFNLFCYVIWSMFFLTVSIPSCV